VGNEEERGVASDLARIRRFSFALRREGRGKGESASKKVLVEKEHKALT